MEDTNESKSVSKLEEVKEPASKNKDIMKKSTKKKKEKKKEQHKEEVTNIQDEIDKMGDVEAKFAETRKKDLEKPSAIGLRDLDKEAEIVKDQELARAEDIVKYAESMSHTGNNTSTYSADYSFSMDHFFTTKSDFDTKFLKPSYFLTKDRQFLWLTVADCYEGKKFKDKFEFWSARLLFAAKLLAQGYKLRMKMDLTTDERFNSIIHRVTHAFESYDYDEMMNMTSEAFNLQFDIKRFRVAYHNNGQDKIVRLNPLPLGNGAVLLRRRARFTVDQNVHTPNENQFLMDCFCNIIHVYNQYRGMNIAANVFQISLDMNQVKADKQVAFLYNNDAVDYGDVHSYIANKIFDYRIHVYQKIRSIIQDSVIVSAANSIVNSVNISNSLNILLTSVSALNSTSSSVFSTNALDVFTTLAAGSCCPGMYSFNMPLSITAGFNAATLLHALAYLLYVPSTLIDNNTVTSIKDWLWTNMLGLFHAGGQAVPSVIFNPFNIQLTNTRPDSSPAFPVGQIPLNSGTTWQNHVLAFPGATYINDPITAFFDYPFARNRAIRGNNNLYAGVIREERFATVLNFLIAMTTLPVYERMIDTKLMNNLRGIVNVIRAQYSAYSDFTRYLTIIVDYVMSLGISNFNAPIVRYQLEISPEKLLALTTKLSWFNVEFTSEFYKIGMWARAANFELSIIVHWFDRLWDAEAYWVIPHISSSKLAKYLEPIRDVLKYMVTTDHGKWVWDNLWSVMKRSDRAQFAALNIIDHLGIANDFDAHEQQVRAYEQYCGYRYQAALNCQTTMNSQNGMYYILAVNQLHVQNAGNTFDRSNFITQVNNFPACFVASSDNDYPCFRLVPTRLTDETVPSNQPYDDLVAGNCIVDIPVYYRENKDRMHKQDLILFRPPVLLPIDLNIMAFTDMNYYDLAQNNFEYDYTGNNIDDIIFKNSSDATKYIKVTKLS